MFLRRVNSYHLRSLVTLPNNMTEPKVFELCGIDNSAIIHAVGCLKRGEVIAVPTDTVYGLAVDSSNSAAIAKLYEVKGRDIKKPLAICVQTVSELKRWGVTDDLPKGLLRKLLPGPVTVLLNRKKRLNPDLNPGETKVGIRVPAETWYPFIHFITATLGYPLALTSANLSNEPNCLYTHEFKHLWPKLSAVFDDIQKDEPSHPDLRLGSTIVDLSEAGSFKITRKGVDHEKTLKTLLKFGLKDLN